MDVLFLICIGVLSRLIPHPANMTAVGAIALFSGAKFRVDKGLVVIFSTMLLSDMIFGFHSVMWATYGSLFLAFLLGRVLKNNLSPYSFTGFSLYSSILFYVITNFAVWLDGSLYPKTLEGLMRCYIMAIPFFRNSVIGDVGYGLIFYYFYAVIPKLNFYKFIWSKYAGKTY